MALPRNRHPSRVLVVAAAGYGKSASLDVGLAPDGLRRPATALLASPLPTVARLAIDDLHRLTPPQQRELLDRTAALSPDIAVTVASRTPLDPETRARIGGEVHDRGPRDLALTVPEVVRLLADGYGVPDPETAARVHALTAGWPALVHFAADALARHPEEDLHESLTGPGAAAAAWLAAEVLDDLPGPQRDLLGLVGALGPVTPRLCERLLGGHDGAGVVDGLRRTGLLVPRRRLRSEQQVLVPVVAGALSTTRGARPGDDRQWAAIARSYEADGLSLPAARAFARAGAHGEVERLVGTHGQQMVREGDAAAVVTLLTGLPTPFSRDLVLTHSDALRLSGDAAGAQRTLSPLVEQAERTGWSPALASRLAAVHHMRGDLPAALDAFDHVDGTDVPLDRDGLEWRAARVHVVASLGRVEDARAAAAETLAAAQHLGRPDLLAAAHLALARTSTGSRKEAHHEHALEAATTADDVVTACRVLVNQSCLLLGEARYAEACAAAREAVRLAEIGSQTGRYAAALHNLGEALTRVGEYDEARWQLRRGVALCRRLGPGRAVGLLGLAELHRELGLDEQARVAYAESAELARGANEVQVLVQALAGWAQVVTDPGAALAAAGEAQRIAPPAQLPFALNALARVALADGRRTDAVGHAEEAVGAARAVHAFDVLAESLETLGVATDDPGRAQGALTEAHAIWHEGGAVPAAARLEVLLGRLDHADGTARSRARQASRQLQRMGILRLHGSPLSEHDTGRRVAVRVLGGFEVRVDRAPVPLPAWRSRQARTLVKILAGRRGRPVTRAHLCELLWPDDDPARTGHRLSVLLATVRGVLDPARAWPNDHHVSADQRGLWLDLRHVDLDADRLLRDAALAAELMDAGERERAREILTDIDERYRGDAFEDEPYEEWADGFREEVRASWQRSLRRLASLHSREGRVADAQVLLVRLLGADPYDAPMHRLLVSTLARAGRYGEARRAFDRWAEAMADIAAPPPDPGVLVAPTLTPR